MALREQDMAYVRDLVYARSAIVLEASKEYLIEARLLPLAREAGFADLAAMFVDLRANAVNGMHTRVVEAMTTNETTFFRDIHPFDALKADILPALREARKTTRAIKIWCAACSTGQEPYSIAMTLREHFPDLAAWRVRILATDLNTAVLQRAREGVYKQLEVNRGLPAAMLTKYFERVGTDFRVKSEVRSLVEYEALNLIGHWTVPQSDVVFLRNVLIYFDVETKKRILARVRASMSADGVLFLGGAETTLHLDDQFERVQYGKSIAYRRKS